MCLLAFAPARAQEDQRLDVPPRWLQRPSERGVLAVWPRDAWEKGLGGRAILRCRISLRGTLTDCSVAREQPEGAGFGAAALALTPQFLLKPGLRDGQPVESIVGIPIEFKAPDLPAGSHIPGAGTIGNEVSLANVVWKEAPTYDDIVAAYPAVARKSGLKGRVALDCEFKSNGRLGNCHAIQEEPEAQGFADAAKKVTSRFVGPDVLPTGESTKGMSTQIAFVFDPDMLDAEKRVVGRPLWAKLPTGAEVAAGYPAAAAKAGVRSARVLLGCDIVAHGRLSQCAVESEEPPGYGFAASALALIASFQVKTWTDEGLPMIGARIRVPIRFQLPEKPPAP